MIGQIESRIAFAMQFEDLTAKVHCIGMSEKRGNFFQNMRTM